MHHFEPFRTKTVQRILRSQGPDRTAPPQALNAEWLYAAEYWQQPPAGAGLQWLV